jgi:hypothetical protein
LFFRRPKTHAFTIIHFHIDTYAYFALLKIGFVFSNSHQATKTQGCIRRKTKIDNLYHRYHKNQNPPDILISG